MSVGKKIIFGIGGIAVVAGALLVWKLGFSAGYVPKEFAEARLQGAVIAQDIVNTSNQIDNDLAAISQNEASDNVDEAITLDVQLIQKSQNLRAQAVDLSNEMEKMTVAVAKVKSDDARALALGAVADRLTIINRLISYSDNLTQLLGALHDRFTGKVFDNSAQVKYLIGQINQEVQDINAYNAHAGQTMDKFDAIMR